MNLVRRIGPDPHAPVILEDGTCVPDPKTPGAAGCPDIWELDTGDFVVIGIDKTDQLRDHLPETAGCGPDERIVWIPRDTLVNAGSEIPGH